MSNMYEIIRSYLKNLLHEKDLLTVDLIKGNVKSIPEFVEREQALIDMTLMSIGQEIRKHENEIKKEADDNRR